MFSQASFAADGKRQLTIFKLGYELIKTVFAK